MKTKILIFIISFVSVAAFAQKKEIRDAGKAIEEGNYTEAKALLKQVEPQISAEKDNLKVDFYLAKANAYLGAEDGKNTSAEELMIAVEAYEKVKGLGEEEAAGQGIMAVRNALINSAIADQNSKKYKDAADKLYKSYELGKQDTIYLYYAAANAVTVKDYETALKYYNELMEIGYDGAETEYLATEKATGEAKSFSSENERDLFVKSGEYIKPETKMSPSKRGEIAKNIALIYVQQDQPEMAIKALEKAKAENPDDIGLMQAEANMYYKMGKIDIYNNLMKEIVKKDPENPTLYYNLAVTSAQMGDTDGAKEYYKKAIQYDPTMESAYVNLAVTILKTEKELLDQMNEALSSGDNKKYDALAKKRMDIYKEALPYLEKVHQINPKNVEAIRTMMNIYYVLEEKTKATDMQNKLNAIEGGQE